MRAGRWFCGCNLPEFEGMRRTAEYTVTWPCYAFPAAHTVFQSSGPSLENLSV